jgi:hypothetical protein
MAVASGPAEPYLKKNLSAPGSVSSVAGFSIDLKKDRGAS